MISSKMFCIIIIIIVIIFSVYVYVCLCMRERGGEGTCALVEVKKMTLWNLFFLSFLFEFQGLKLFIFSFSKVLVLLWQSNRKILYKEISKSNFPFLKNLKINFQDESY